MKMNDVVLIGDSVFDNGAYVDESSVVYEMRKILIGKARVTLLAEDGAVVADIGHQIKRIPKTATHIVLSVGGNDAILTGRLFWHKQVSNSRDAFTNVARYMDDFAIRYEQMFRELSSLGVPITICTIYDSVPNINDYERAGLCLFNDVITRYAALAAGIIDLRVHFTRSELFSKHSPIEPSDCGSEFLAKLICTKLGFYRELVNLQ